MIARQTLVSLFATAALATTAFAQQGSAYYELTFQSTWSAATHPTAFPGNPHYSPLVGATHNDSVSFWQPGGMASSGIEDMAETGGTFQMQQTINPALNAGTADQFLNFGGPGALGNSPGQLTVGFTVDATHPLLTLVTMIAPSPDWFLGVHDLPLLVDGDWVDNIVVPLHAYDAGTDSGVSYTSANNDTNPQDPIAMVTTASGPFQGASTLLGTFTITRKSSTAVFGCSNPAGSLQVGGSAEIGQTLQIALSDPTGQFPTPAVSGLAIGLTPSNMHPCGVLLPDFGLANGTSGEILLGSLDILTAGPTFNGGLSLMFLPIANDPGLIGGKFYAQGFFVSSRIGVTEALAVFIGN